MRLFVITFFILSFFLVPGNDVSAQLVPLACADPNSCGTCEFVELINNVVQFIISMASIIAVGIFIYAGILLVVSGGNTDAVGKAKRYFTNVAIGYVLILAGFLIIDTTLKILLPTDSPILSWRTVECLYPVPPTASELPTKNRTSRLLGEQAAGGGSCKIDAGAGGACSASSLLAAGFPAQAATTGAILCSAESAFDTAAESGVDIALLPDGSETGYSIGLFQINLSVHTMNCGGETLNCPAAFYDTGRRKNGIKLKGVRENQMELFNRCRVAAATASCNIAKAKQLFTSSGDWGDWACTTKKCGIPTSRNHLCKSN